MKKFLLTLSLILLTVSLVFANGAAEKKEPLTWWEHLETFTAMNTKMLEDFTKETGIETEYTISAPDKMLESLPIAFRSNQLPDLFSMPTDAIDSLLTMKEEGWFTPLTVKLEDLPKEFQDSMFEGITLFDGQVYSVPMFYRNHNALLFYHPSMVDEVPETYKEFYESCKKVYKESNGKVYGIVLPMTFTDRMDTTFEQMMSAANASVINWKTGEYNWDSKEMIELFTVLTKMWDEGLIHPGSVNFNMKEARERWAAGEAAYLIDGIWNVGITKNNFNPTLEDFDVADPIRPTKGDYMVYVNPPKGNYYIGGGTSYQKEATDLFLNMISAEYQVAIANVQDQPPFNLDSLKQANVDDSYVKGCQMFVDSTGYNPLPILRNLAVAQVTGNMRTISPTPCQILNGYFSGAIKDWEKALHEYNTAISAERDAQIAKANAAGYSVSKQDWVFPNFVFGESFTTDNY